MAENSNFLFRPTHGPDVLSSTNSMKHGSMANVVDSERFDQDMGCSSSDAVVEEAQYCPEAVVYWYLHGLDNKKNKGGDQISQMRFKARKHLLAMKWVFWYGDKGGKKELRYTSPQGKIYYSLRMACKACMDEGEIPKNVAFSNVNTEPQVNTKPSDLLPSRKRKRTDKRSNLEQPRRGKVLKTLMNLRDDQKTIEPTPVWGQGEVLPSSSSCNPRVVLSRLIANNVVLPGAHVYYRSSNRAGLLAEGWITSCGIKCKCCNKVFTISDFEVHAGSKKHRPGPNIILDDGRSLLDCQREMLFNKKLTTSTAKLLDLKKENNTQEKNQVDNYDICCVCHYGGELVLCDLCPSTFHKGCLGLKDVPSGAWFCPSCCCEICGEGKFEKKLKHSVGDDIVCTCDQCKHKFHMGCLRSRGAVKVKNAHDKWFCSDRCENIFSSLQKLSRKPISLGVDNLTWRLLKSMESDHQDSNASADSKVLTENQRRLNVAVEVMHECFEPAKDPFTGRDLVEDVIFNRRSEEKHRNFQGFYTVVLERKGKMASVAAVRVFEEIAEIPLVATRFKYRRLGLCRRLMDELEKQLLALGVMRLMLPAAPAVLDTWITKFGFSKMIDVGRLKYLNYAFLDFQDTIMCYKLLMKKPFAPLCPPGTTGSKVADADIKLACSSPVSVLQGEQVEEPEL